MWQRDKVELMPGTLNAKAPANNRLQAATFDELCYRQPSDGYHQLRPKNLELFVEPDRTIPNFVRRWDPISATGRLSRKTAADRREINLGP